MKVSDAIKYLQEQYDPDDHVVMAWWDHDMFEEVEEEDWPDVAEHIEGRMDWSYAHDTMTWMAEDWHRDYKAGDK